MSQITQHGFTIGDDVIATPDSNDSFHEFQGRVNGFRGFHNSEQFITVVDQEDNCWDCFPHQLKHA